MGKTANPLAEAAATPSLDAFFEREPDSLSDEEIDQAVAAMREERERFLSKPKKKHKVKGKPANDDDDATEENDE